MAGLTVYSGANAPVNQKVMARVVSAAALKESQVSTLEVILSKKLKKQVEITLEVDPSLIGGLYIHVEGRVVNRTVKKLLSDLKDRIIRRDAG